MRILALSLLVSAAVAAGGCAASSAGPVASQATGHTSVATGLTGSDQPVPHPVTPSARRDTHRHRPAPKHHYRRDKPLIHGLIDMASQRSYVLSEPFPTATPDEIGPDAAAFHGVVVNETWAQLEPTDHHYTWGPLTRSLAAVRAYNTAHPDHQLAVKLRVFPGFTAPDWAKSLDGPAVTETAGHRTGTLGRWWAPHYRAAWSTFQHALAARFDGNQLVQEVAVTSCGQLSGEPFVEPLNPAVLPQVLAHGYTNQAEESCLTGALGDYSGWHTTAIDYPFNPFRQVVDGRAVADPGFTDKVMRRCARSERRGGPRCVLGNNALSGTPAQSRSAPVYSEISTLRRHDASATHVYFQTVGGPADCEQLASAVHYGAGSVELWPANQLHQGFQDLPRSQLTTWDRELRHHRAPHC